MSDDVEPVYSTGVGSWPGSDIAEALRITFAECPDFAYLPELPDRGAFAALIGRGTAFLSGLAVDLQPAGWRLTDGSGRDHRRATSTVRSDLDELEEAAQGYVGPFKLSFAGPWTLAANVERPRGDRVLADSGARRDLCQSLAEGISQTISELRRRLPDLRPVVQLDEPALPSVFAGAVPTASGFSRHRAVAEEELANAFSGIVAALTAATGSESEGGSPVVTPVVVHCCAAGVPVRLLHDAGVRGVAVDLDQVTTADWDAIGAAMEEGMWLGAGALPTGTRPLSPDQVSERVLRPVRALGLEPAVSARMLVTPACGLAGLAQADALRALRTVRTAAEIVTERLTD